MGAASCHLSVYPASPANCQTVLLLPLPTPPQQAVAVGEIGGGGRTHPVASFHSEGTLGPCHPKTINSEEHKTGDQVGWLGKQCSTCKLGLLVSWPYPAIRPVLLPSALAPVGDVLGNVLEPYLVPVSQRLRQKNLPKWLR